MGHGEGGHDPLPTFAEDTVLLGRIAIALAARFPEWVRRRTTTFQLLDEKACVQRLDVTLRLPPQAWFSRGKGDDLARMLTAGSPKTIYVPLNIVRKGALAAFRVADAHDENVSMRNRVERCRLTVDAYASLLEEYAGDRGVERPSGSFRGLLESIVAEPRPHTATDTLRRALGAGGELHELMRAEDPYARLLAELANGFMMLVPVRYPSTDHLFHISSTVPYRWTSGSLREAGTLVFSSLGLTAKVLAFPGHRIGWAQSTHFVVHEPAGSHNLRTALLREEPAREPSAPGEGCRLDVPESPKPVKGARKHLGTPSGRRVLRTARSVRAAPLHEVPAGPHADVSVPLSDLAKPLSGSGDCATVTIRLSPRRSGAFGAITVVAWISAGLLALILHYLSAIDLEASTTVAVVLPALVAASLIRQGEHAVAGLLLAGVRWCGLLVIVSVFAAATFMAVNDPQLRMRERALATCDRRAASVDHGLVTVARPGMRFACDVADGTATSQPPPVAERTAVLVGFAGTAVATLVLSLGMLATGLRVVRARWKPPMRDGTPVGAPGASACWKRCPEAR